MRNIIQDVLRSIKLVSLGFIVIIMIYSCENASIDIDENDNDQQLIGDWDWLYTLDPRSSETWTPETENYTRYLKFNNKSKALFFSNDTLSRECIYSTSVKTFSDGTSQTFVDLCDRLIPYNVYNDSLEISYAATDGYAYYYIKRK